MTRKHLVLAILGGVWVSLSLSVPAPAQERVSATEKGSLLIFPKVEIRWDAAGNVIQDTFIDLTNDYPADVQVQMYFVNGDSPMPAGVGVNWNNGRAVGDTVAVVTVPNVSTNGIGIGIAVDCEDPANLYYTNTDDPTIHKMDAAGNDLGSVPITDSASGAPISFGAIAWDDTRGLLWGGTDNSGLPVRVYRIDPVTGVATYVFDQATPGCCGFCDGIAYDPSDDTVYVSDDADTVIDQHSASTGAHIRTLTPTDAVGDPLDLISGVLVGAGDLLYLGRNGLGEITMVKKSDGSFIGTFASPGGRDEDLECDVRSFPGLTVIWSKDAYDDTVTAIEVAPGTCECGGGQERPHPGWNWVDVGIELTANEPTYWSALTGLPKGVSPFTILDPGDPPGRPASDGSGDRVLRGTVLAWAVNANGQEIRWNHLKGDALIVNYLNGSAWEYNALAYQSHFVPVVGDANGAVLPVPGELLMNGSEYDMNFGQLLLDFYAVGSTAPSGGGRIVSVNTDLTLLPLGIDLRQETGGPVTTKANFDIWNMNEWHFSGTERCITCWDQELLGNYDAPNHFLLGNLQTDKGKARIDGLASQWCDFDYDPTDGALGSHPMDVISRAAPLVALSMKVLTFGAGSDFAMAGSNVVGMGTDLSAVIRADVISSPPPERPGIGFNNPPKPTTGVVR